MARRGRADNLIKCEYCGELYSDSYSHCPFCNEDGTGRWDDIEKGLEDGGTPEYTEYSGGRRLMQDGGGGRRGPSVWSVIKAILSMGLIIAAICIVVMIVKSILTGGQPVEPGASEAPEAAQTPGVTDVIDSLPPAGQDSVIVQPDGSVIPADPNAPAVPVAPDGSVVPAPGTTPPPVAGQPTGFSLNRTDFSFRERGEVFNMQVSFAPAGTKAEVQWKSSDPNVASVSWNGVVTAITPGTATVTATVPGVGEQSCIVRCKFAENAQPAGNEAPAATAAPAETAAPAASAAPAPEATKAPEPQENTGGLSLNLTDFTMREKGEKVKLKVSGTEDTVVWSIADDSVATLAGDGTVTAVSKGMTKVTASVNGTKLTCIVRCSF